MAKKSTAVLPLSDQSRQVLLTLIRQSGQPQTAKQLAKQLTAPFKATDKQLLAVLEEHVVSGALHKFPPVRGQTSYWDRDLVEFGRVLIVRSLDKKGPQAKANLRKVAKDLSDAQFQQAFQRLIDSRRVYEHPPIGTSKALKYGSKPPAPEAYLKDVGSRLTKIVGQLTAVGVGREVLTNAMLTLLGQSGLPVTTSADSRRAANDSPLDSLDLLMLMRQIEPGAERGALVAARDLRRAANLDKSRFDRAVLELARQGRLMLHRHDYASGLTVAQRDELVTDGVGTYFVGMVLRRAVV